jgi:hypothetical protein
MVLYKESISCVVRAKAAPFDGASMGWWGAEIGSCLGWGCGSVHDMLDVLLQLVMNSSKKS